MPHPVSADISSMSPLDREINVHNGFDRKCHEQDRADLFLLFIHHHLLENTMQFGAAITAKIPLWVIANIGVNDVVDLSGSQIRHGTKSLGHDGYNYFYHNICQDPDITTESSGLFQNYDAGLAIGIKFLLFFLVRIP